MIRWCAFSFVSAFSLASCYHEAGEEPIAPAFPVHTVEQHLVADFRYGSHTYELASVYTDTEGAAFRLDTFRVLLSGLRAVNDEGEVIADYSNIYVLLDASQASNDFTLGELTSDHLHEIRFNIGLEPIMNHTPPADAPPPMSDGVMFSGDTGTGYYLLEMAGRVDSNGDGTIDNTDQTFSYRCMGDELLNTSAASVHANLPEGGVLLAWLPVDMHVMLANVDFLATPSTDGNNSLQIQLLQQLVDAMEQEH